MIDPVSLLVVGGIAVVAFMTRPVFDLHPLARVDVRSRFGTRTDPVTGAQGAFHNGVDYACPIGTPMVSIGQGRVAWVDEVGAGNSGKNVGIRGTGKHAGWTWSYSHCSDVLVVVGENVEPGQVVAESGNTGKSTGPHLHFVVKRGDTYVDPLSVLPSVGGPLGVV